MESREPSDELRANVHADETVEWVVRPHRGTRFLANAGRGAIGALFGAALVAALVAGVLLFLIETPRPTAIAAAVGTFLVLTLLSLRGALVVLLFGSMEYAATDQRLLRYGGVFGRRLDGVPFDGIQDAEYTVSTIQNLFDVGTVTLDTRRGYERLRFEHVPTPAVFAREVSDLASEAREEEGETPGTYAPGEDLATDEPDAGLTDNLYGHEELQWVVRPRRGAQLLRRLPGGFLSAAFTGLVLGFLAAGGALFATGQVETALLAVVGVAAAVLLLFLLGAVVTYLLDETQYAATDRRLVSYDATIGRRLDSVPLRGVQDAEYRISPVENLFDVGTVTVDTDPGYETLGFESVRDPATFAREVSRLAASDLGQRAVVDPDTAARTDDLSTSEPGDGLRESVSADEGIDWVVRPHGAARFLGTIGSSLVGAVITGLVLGAIAGVAVAATVDTRTGGLAAVGVFLAVLLLLLVKPTLQFLFGGTEYALTDDRLVDYSGLFSRELRSIPLEGIQDAEYRVSSTENLFDVGTVTVDTHRGYETMTLNTVPKPAAVAREISRAASAAGMPEGVHEDFGGATGASGRDASAEEAA